MCCWISPTNSVWTETLRLPHSTTIIYLAEIRAEEAQALDRNITGVPAMIVEGKMLIPGAQTPKVYVGALRRVAERFPADSAAAS